MEVYLKLNIFFLSGFSECLDSFWVCFFVDICFTFSSVPRWFSWLDWKWHLRCWQIQSSWFSTSVHSVLFGRILNTLKIYRARQMFHPCRSPQRHHWCNGKLGRTGWIHAGTWWKKSISWEVSILAVMSVLGSDNYKVYAAAPDIITRILHQK